MVGPNTDNAREIVSQLIDTGAALQVRNIEEFQKVALKILSDSPVREQMGQAGLALVEKNKGALDQTLAAIETQLSG
jgi:3-deoxy-D-manno-octulosonic-acid transferase